MLDSKKYRKALFNTNDPHYPYLFLDENNMYHLITTNMRLSGDVFDGEAEVLKYLPKADLEVI